MSMIFGLLYVTTMLHWYKVQDGIIKKIDIGVALLTIYRLTCVEDSDCFQSIKPTGYT
jgi:hypothetical protein